MNIPFVFPAPSSSSAGPSGKNPLPRPEASFDLTFRQTQIDDAAGSAPPTTASLQTRDGRDAAAISEKRSGSSSGKTQGKNERKEKSVGAEKRDAGEKKTDDVDKTQSARAADASGPQKKEAERDPADSAHDASENAQTSPDGSTEQNARQQEGSAEETVGHSEETPATKVAVASMTLELPSPEDSGADLLRNAGILPATDTTAKPAPLELPQTPAANFQVSQTELANTAAPLMTPATATNDSFLLAVSEAQAMMPQADGKTALPSAKDWKSFNHDSIKTLMQMQGDTGGDTLLSQAINAMSEQNGVSQEDLGQMFGQSLAGQQSAQATPSSGGSETTFVLPTMTPPTASFSGGASTATALARPSVFQPLTENQIANQVIEHLNVNSLKESSSVRIRLHPEELGQVKLELQITRDVVTAHLHTENRQVQDALLGQMERLRHSLAEQGLNLGDIFVSVDGGQSQNNDSMSKDRSFHASTRGSQGLQETGASEDEPSLLVPGASYTIGGLSLMV